jgi:hypothetical protein
MEIDSGQEVIMAGENGNGLNGAARIVFGALAVASGVISTIGGILFAGVYRDQDASSASATRNRLELIAAVADVRADAKQERERMRLEFAEQFAELTHGRRENEVRIVALQASVIEIETQLRAVSTVANMERYAAEAIADLLQQCLASGGKCKVPERHYFPPGPGPDGQDGVH